MLPNVEHGQKTGEGRGAGVFMKEPLEKHTGEEIAL